MSSVVLANNTKIMIVAGRRAPLDVAIFDPCMWWTLGTACSELLDHTVVSLDVNGNGASIRFIPDAPYQSHLPCCAIGKHAKSDALDLSTHNDGSSSSGVHRYFDTMTTSVRRLSERPNSVVLSAIGRMSPYPTVRIRFDAMPFFLTK